MIESEGSNEFSKMVSSLPVHSTPLPIYVILPYNWNILSGRWMHPSKVDKEEFFWKNDWNIYEENAIRIRGDGETLPTFQDTHWCHHVLWCKSVNGPLMNFNNGKQ